MTSPARANGISGLWLLASLVTALIAAVFVARRVAEELRRARRQADDERARTERDWSDHLPPPDFINTTILSASALLTLSAPIVAGAVVNRLWRQEMLASDTRTMLAAKIDMIESDPRLGPRWSVEARPDGVLIRNINIQDLVSQVYGIGQFEVFGGALPWLESPRYDVRVKAPVHAPEVFDPYALRQPITQYLADRFGASIRVNGSCQEPCINQQSFVIERLR